MITLVKGDRVLCSRLGTEEFEIVKVSDHEYRVKSTTTNKEEQIYKAHCHTPPELMQRNMRNRREAKLARANQVGNPTPKKK